MVPYLSIEPTAPRILPGSCQHTISDRVSVPKRPRVDPWSLEPASPLKLASLTCFVGACSLGAAGPTEDPPVSINARVVCKSYTQNKSR